MSLRDLAIQMMAVSDNTATDEAGVVCYPGGGTYAVAVFTRATSWEPIQPAVDGSIGTAARAAVEDLRTRGAAAPSLAPG